MRARRALVALLVVVAAGGAPVRAGVQDTPLPTFSDGQAAQLAALIPGAIKDNNVETVVICTNLAPAALDVGLEVFDETGALRNSIAAGDGAFLDVAPGAQHGGQRHEQPAQWLGARGGERGAARLHRPGRRPPAHHRGSRRLPYLPAPESRHGAAHSGLLPRRV